MTILTERRFKHFTVFPATPLIGGTIEGLHLSKLDDESAAELREALWDNFGTVHYGVTADVGDAVRRLYRVAAWSKNVQPSLDRAAAVSQLLSAGAQ